MTVADEHSTTTNPGDASSLLKTMFSLAHDLSAVQRFSRVRMVHPESVLEHTGLVCVFAYIIGRHLNRLRGYRVEMGKVMCRATVHDWDETITGDIVRPTKYFSETLRSELSKLEARGINNVSNQLNSALIVVDFMRAKHDEEGFIVAMADLLAAIYRVWIETMVNGNRAMVQPAKHMRATLKKKITTRIANHFSGEQNDFLARMCAEADSALDEVSRLGTPLPSLHGEW